MTMLVEIGLGSKNQNNITPVTHRLWPTPLMFKAIRISILLAVLIVVAGTTWLTQQRTTDWAYSLWVRVYPINADNHPETDRHIDTLTDASFDDVEQFIATEAARYGVTTSDPVRIDLGRPILEQPPALAERPNVLDAILWSLKMRWWASTVTEDQEDYQPDVRVFVRYHQPATTMVLENSVGVRKGMFGIVNAYTGRAYRGRNNVVFAHELLHTIGASDKYNPHTNQPVAPQGLGEPDREPLYPQRLAEIMGGRIALSDNRAEMPRTLKQAVIGPETAREIRLLDENSP